MVCPRCETTNSSNAATCKRCGYRFRRQAPAPQQQSARRNTQNNEKKYIIVGSLTLLFLVLVLVGIITSISCMCSNCAACADRADNEYINESVSGEWQGEEYSSSTDLGIVDETVVQ